MGAAQILEGLVDIISREIVAKAGLNLKKRRGLVSGDEVNFLPGEGPALRMDAISAGGAWHLVDLVKEVIGGGEPERIVSQCDRDSLDRDDARLEIGIEQVLP